MLRALDHTPTIALKSFSNESGYISGAVLRIDADAQPGERLVIVNSVSGKHIGLVGILIGSRDVFE